MFFRFLPVAFTRARHSIRLPIALILSIIVFPSQAIGAPEPRIVASRISGPAPLAVFFDASGTTDPSAGGEPFIELGYMFTFGDPDAGVWSHTGLNKNEQVGGPLAAHVFERSGLYNVQVAAKNQLGEVSYATITVEVQSPESVFPSSQTVCLSRNSDFSGCPQGAEQIGNASSWPNFESNHRYLLRRGQDFQSLGGIQLSPRNGIGISDVQLAAFGVGAAPVVQNIDLQSAQSGEASWPARIVVMDLDARNITNTRGGFDILFLRNRIVRGGMIEFASAFDFWLTQSSATGVWRNPENIFIVDNVIDRGYDRTVASNPNGITGNATRLALLGNEIDRTYEHNIRIWQGSKVVIAHNNLSGRSDSHIRQALKMHSSGLEEVQDRLTPGVAQRQRTSEVVIADNLIGSGVSNINWLGATGAQNNISTEGMEFVIWEDNVFRHGPNYFRDITWSGRQMSERGNINATDGGRAASVGIAGELAMPANWQGPYFQQPSIKTWFEADRARPRSPALTVE